ncbi:hypothetical protein EJ07DRAFT_178721 [Lizonia empirigonia]|nr:hypothetical protein EJ07DRAFT_178721 [Lizonia empirigonia]
MANDFCYEIGQQLRDNFAKRIYDLCAQALDQTANTDASLWARLQQLTMPTTTVTSREALVIRDSGDSSSESASASDDDDGSDSSSGSDGHTGHLGDEIDSNEQAPVGLAGKENMQEVDLEGEGKRKTLSTRVTRLEKKIPRRPRVC